MKTYLYPHAIVAQFPQHQILQKLFAVALALALSVAAFADNSNPVKLRFQSPTLISGVAGQDGAVYKFSQVTSGVDCLVKINGRSNALVSLLSMDISGSGWAGKAFQPQVTYNNNTTPGGISDWWLEFQFSFVIQNSTLPAVVSEFNVSAIDIDGNGDKIAENVSFFGLSTFKVDANSMLIQSSLLDPVTNAVAGKKFQGPTVNFLNIDTSGTAVMVEADYLLTNSFKLRAGGHSTGVSGAADRMYSFSFESFTFTSPMQFGLPLVMTSFTAGLNNSSKKVELKWTTGMEKQLSHFVIERSTNGLDYSEVGMVFAYGTTNVKQNYSFNDPINTKAKGMLYYRLRMMDADGRFQRSAVKIIRLGEEEAQVKLEAYPNPVVNQLRVTVPSSWQNQKVSYEVYSVAGTMVKKIVSNNASQTETIDMQNVNSGHYVVKVYTQNESASQSILKK